MFLTRAGIRVDTLQHVNVDDCDEQIRSHTLRPEAERRAALSSDRHVAFSATDAVPTCLRSRYAKFKYIATTTIGAAALECHESASPTSSPATRRRVERRIPAMSAYDLTTCVGEQTKEDR